MWARWALASTPGQAALTPLPPKISPQIPVGASPCPGQGEPQVSSLQSLIRVWLFETPWTTACHSLSITNSRSLLKPMSIELVMPSNHLTLCRPLLLLPPIFPSIKVFYNESALHMRWPKYCRFGFSLSPSNEYSELISFRVDWLDLPSVHGTLQSLLQHSWKEELSTTVQKHQFFGAQLSL